MASLMDDLVAVLNEENAYYADIVELAKEKRQAIIQADIKNLEHITGKEQDVTTLLHNLDLKREGIMKDIANVLGRSTEDLTISKLISFLDKQPKEQERLSNIREELIATGKEIGRWNQENKSLLDQALEMVEFDLTLFKSLRQAPETANYNRAACNTGELLGDSGFDAKQ